MFLIQINKNLKENEIFPEHAYKFFVHETEYMSIKKFRLFSICGGNFYLKETDSIIMFDKKI